MNGVCLGFAILAAWAVLTMLSNERRRLTDKPPEAEPPRSDAAAAIPANAAPASTPAH